MRTNIAELRSSLAAPEAPQPREGLGVLVQRQNPYWPKAETSFVARFAVLNLIGAALIGAAWVEGLLLKPFEADSSGMCYLITVLFAWGLACCLRRDWQSVRWAGNALVYLGMVGTVLGLIITVSDLSTDKAESFENFRQIVTSIYTGSGTALYTNLLACIGYLWLGTNAHLLARQEV
jgi:hypothetical protein